MDGLRTGWIGLGLRALGVLLVGAGAGLAHNALSDRGIPLHTPQNLTLADYVNWNLHLKGMHVSLEDAKEAFDRKGAIFIDARSPYSYTRGHIPGALNLMGSEVASRGKDLLADLSRDAHIITYCSGGSCQSSLKLAELLREQLGFTRVKAFYGGWTEWTAAGNPVKEGEEP